MDDLLSRRAPYAAVPYIEAPWRLLVGVMSGSDQRRTLLRQSFAARRCDLRVVYVVGTGVRPLRDDMLAVNVSERRGAVRAKPGATPSGTLTTLVKLMAFFEYAARAPEPWSARIDDDALVNPCLARQYMARLDPARPILAGVFEYYNIHSSGLRSTGHAYGLRGSRGFGRRMRNCSATFLSAPCFGPVAFPKGPLLFASRTLVRAIVGGAAWNHTLAQIERTPTPTYRVHDDVFAGVWASQVPRTTYVRLMRKRTWLDGSVDVLWPHELLSMHRAHPACFRTVRFDDDRRDGYNQSYACVETPPCTDCAHRPDQRICRLHLLRAGPSTTCD